MKHSFIGNRNFSSKINKDNSPIKYVAKFDLSVDLKYLIKNTYKSIPLIYAFYNKKTNKFYVGKTISPESRFKNYFSLSYLIKNKIKWLYVVLY